MKRLQKVRARMLLGSGTAGHADTVFYATFLMSTPQVMTETVPLMATDGRSIFINPTAAEQEPEDVLTTLLVHEVEHMAFHHIPRMIGRDRDRWNRATDYVINQRLQSRGFHGWEGWLCDPHRFGGMFEEQIYQQLQCEDGSDASDPRMGSDMQPEGAVVSPADAAAQYRTIQQRVATSANAARMAGQMSSTLARLVSDILEPKIAWRDELREFMTRVMSDVESWTRRNRRFKAYLPSRHSLAMGEIVYIADVSGSITSEEHDRSMAEVGYIADHVRPSLIRVIGADTEVTSEQTFEVGEPLDCQLKGGGGTDMRVPLAYVEQYDPQVVVLMTDGYTPWPDREPPYPLIVVCTTNAPVPIGRVIRL